MIINYYSENKDKKFTFLQTTFYKLLLLELPDEKIIGEDIYGNILIEIEDTVKIISHEDLSITETYINLDVFKETIKTDGFAWIDCYSSIDEEILEKYKNILQPDEVLHWIQPLFLGGEKSIKNITKINRIKHWEGHLSLLEQMSGTEIGGHIIIKKDG